MLRSAHKIMHRLLLACRIVYRTSTPPFPMSSDRDHAAAPNDSPYGALIAACVHPCCSAILTITAWTLWEHGLDETRPNWTTFLSMFADRRGAAGGQRESSVWRATRSTRRTPFITRPQPLSRNIDLPSTGRVYDVVGLCIGLVGASCLKISALKNYLS